jgi:O-antigen ligase
MAVKVAHLRAPGLLERIKGRSESPSVPRMISAARVLLVVTLMAAPMAFGSVQAWAWAGLTVMAAVLLMLWAVGCIQQGMVKVYWSSLYVPAALFLLLGIGQFAGHLTLDPFGTREALVKLVTDLILFFLAGQLWVNASSRAWKWFGLAVVIYGFSIALFAIFQFFTSHGLLYWTIHSKGGIFGPYVNHNDYAGLMEMLIPIGMCYALYRSLKNSNQALLVWGVCVGIASVLLSGSRGGIISVAVEMMVLGAIIWRWKEGRSSVRKWSVAGLVGVVGTAALFVAITPEGAWQHLATIAGVVQTPDVTLENRVAVSRDALAEVRNYPWLGTGLGSFDAVFPQYQTFSTDLGWNHAHDDYVEAVTETGLVGGLIILSALLLFGRLAFRNLRGRLNDARGWVQLGAALGCCGLLVHSFSDFNLHIPSNAAWFGVCAALATVPVSALPSMESPRRRREPDQTERPADIHSNHQDQTTKKATADLVESER